MGFSSWLRNRVSGRGPRGRACPRPAAPRLRPCFEALEDRTVPTTVLKVFSLADFGRNTLRDAILQADKGPANSPYEIDIAVPGTIRLGSSLPDLANR